MLDITKTPVACTVQVDLGEQRGRRIIEVPASQQRTKVESFVNLVFPKQKIEHLGRVEMTKIDGGYSYICSPSSLFFQTVYAAYADHHALGLRPEVLMHLICSVVAETVRRHPEDYRHLFTVDAGKLDIKVRHDGLRLGDQDSPWDEAIGLFDEALRPHVPSRIMHEMLPEFTTSTIETQVASLVAFMDAASPFYSYELQTMCGIPRIVLFGEPADYRRLVVATTQLAKNFQKHLSDYFANLVPVLETIATTAETGKADQDFWSQFYKHQSASGSSKFGGWISSFLWYVQMTEGRKKPVLAVKDVSLLDWRKIDQDKGWGGQGIDTGSEPSHVSRVPFKWKYFDKEMPMHFIGGILGVDVADGALTPNLSYGVLHA